MHNKNCYFILINTQKNCNQSKSASFDGINFNFSLAHKWELILSMIFNIVVVGIEV